MEDIGDALISITKVLLGIIIIFLVLCGLTYLSTDRLVREDITYIENGVEIDVFKYQNQIYIKKGE